MAVHPLGSRPENTWVKPPSLVLSRSTLGSRSTQGCCSSHLSEAPSWSPPPVSSLIHLPQCYTNIIFYVCHDVKKKMGITVQDYHLLGTLRRELLT